MGCPPSAARAHHGEVCAVDNFQLVAVRVAHRADADHTSQLGGEGGGGQGRKTGSWIQDLHTFHANKCKVGVIEAIVCDSSKTYTGGRVGTEGIINTKEVKCHKLA